MKQLHLFNVSKVLEQTQKQVKKTGKKKPRKRKKKTQPRKQEPVIMRFCKRCLCRIDADKIPVCNAVCAFCFRDNEVSGGFNKWFIDHFHALEPLEKGEHAQVKQFGELVCQYQQADRCARIAVKYLEKEPRPRKQRVLIALDAISFPPPLNKVLIAWRKRVRKQIRAAVVREEEPLIDWDWRADTKQEDWKLPTLETKRRVRRDRRERESLEEAEE